MIFESLLDRNVKMLEKRVGNGAPLHKRGVSSATLGNDLLGTNIAVFKQRSKKKVNLIKGPYLPS